jgi:hypothetical protein
MMLTRCSMALASDGESTTAGASQTLAGILEVKLTEHPTTQLSADTIL